MSRTTHLLLAAAISTGFTMPAAYAATDSPAALAVQTKVTESQATAIALELVPHGIVKSAELEKEHGRLVWSFDIAAPSVRGVTEILVDARTGKIVSLKKESPAEEAEELKADAAAK